jgi:transcriptional regulator with XRE-family HTH domain
MPVSKLPNYLRAHRKRLGLSQQQVAFLLGCRSGAKVSRYERFTREPTLRTAFACEVIFHTPARELFAGIYEEVEHETERRARILARRLALQQEKQRKAAA